MLAKLLLRLLGLLLLTLAIGVPSCQVLFRPSSGAPFHPGFEHRQQQPVRGGGAATPVTPLASP